MLLFLAATLLGSASTAPSPPSPAAPPCTLEMLKARTAGNNILTTACSGANEVGTFWEPTPPPSPNSPPTPSPPLLPPPPPPTPPPPPPPTLPPPPPPTPPPPPPPPLSPRPSPSPLPPPSTFGLQLRNSIWTVDLTPTFSGMIIFLIGVFVGSFVFSAITFLGGRVLWVPGPRVPGASATRAAAWQSDREEGGDCPSPCSRASYCVTEIHHVAACGCVWLGRTVCDCVTLYLHTLYAQSLASLWEITRLQFSATDVLYLGVSVPLWARAKGQAYLISEVVEVRNTSIHRESTRVFPGASPQRFETGERSR